MTSFACLICDTNNVGDDIQTLAALQYLPDGVPYVQRERLDEAHVAQGTKLILNGWFLHDVRHWPPSPALDPLVVSFHASRKRFAGTPALDFLRRYSRTRQVGARDLDTLDILAGGGIDAYWSGCLTLTLHSAPVARRDDLVAVDLAAANVALIRQRTRRLVRTATHYHVPQRRGVASWLPALRLRTMSPLRRLATARARLVDYAAAGVVVTGRLHVALPCLAMGTPILFVVADPDDPRHRSWLQHLHWCSLDAFRAGSVRYDLNAPPPNPDGWQSMADALAVACRDFTGIAPRPFDAVGGF